MSKICSSCGFQTDDSRVFCPACGTVFPGAEEQTVAANDPVPVPGRAPGHFARPINVDMAPHYAQPKQMTPPYRPTAANPSSAPVDPVPVPAPVQKPKKSWPYILLGVGAAAIIFTAVLLIILLTDKDKTDSSGGITTTTSTTAPTTSSGTSLTGTYKLKEATGASADDFNTLKDDLTLEVDSDGTATMYLYGSVEIAAFEFDESLGVAYYNGQPIPFTYSGGVLTIEDSADKLVFEK